MLILSVFRFLYASRRTVYRVNFFIYLRQNPPILYDKDASHFLAEIENLPFPNFVNLQKKLTFVTSKFKKGK